MLLPAGMRVRFKGRHADDNARFLADELHGRCRRNGLELEVTKETRLVAHVPERDQTSCLTREEVVEFGSNGHAEATRL